MSIVMALIVAAVFGTGDFCGGLATKRMPAVRVVGGSHLIGLFGVLLAAVLIDNEIVARDIAIGAAGGLFGAIGVGLLYRTLSTGPMSVVAPVTAVTSAALPAAFGVATGERFTAPGWLGVALAFVAIWLTARSSDTLGASISLRVVVESLLAGVGFGLFFIFMDLTSEASAPWPVVGARAFSTLLLGGFLLSRRLPLLPSEPTSLGLVVLTGVFDTTSNVLFLYAIQIGDLTTVSVLSSLYPIATIVLARVILHERSSRTQLIGAGVALVATVLISLG